MATQKTTSDSAKRLAPPNGDGTAVETPQQRQAWRSEFPIEAASEIFNIADLMQREPDLDPNVIRGLAIRIEQLASVILSSAEELDTEESAAESLHGPAIVRQRAREASHG
jgi:hypothetical protein